MTPLELEVARIADSSRARRTLRQSGAFFACLVSLLVVAACATAPGSSRSGAHQSPEARLRALDSLWAHAYAANDTVAADRLYASRLVFTSADGRVKSKQDEMGDVRPSPGFVMEYFRTTPTSVRATADSGVVEGHAAWRFTTNGQSREVRRSYVTTWARGGPFGWQIVAVRMGAAP